MLIKDWNAFFQVESNVLEVLRRPTTSKCPTDQIHVYEMSECPKRCICPKRRICPNITKLPQRKPIQMPLIQRSKHAFIYIYRYKNYYYLRLEHQLPFMSPLGTFFVSL